MMPAAALLALPNPNSAPAPVINAPAAHLDGLRPRANEGDASLSALAGKLSALRQEAVARVDGVDLCTAAAVTAHSLLSTASKAACCNSKHCGAQWLLQRFLLLPMSHELPVPRQQGMSGDCALCHSFPTFQQLEALARHGGRAATTSPCLYRLPAP